MCVDEGMPSCRNEGRWRDRHARACCYRVRFKAVGAWCAAFPREYRHEGERMIDAAVSIGPLSLAGQLNVPQEAQALILFAHGSGSSRRSPRNRYVGERLQRGNLGTLLFDLLKEDEAGKRANVFDVAMLAHRLAQAIDWCQTRSEVAPLSIGLFGASTGAGAALMAAAERPQSVYAVVSRGGRPGPRCFGTAARARAHSAHRRRGRPGSAGVQPKGIRAVDLREAVEAGAGCDAPVRGARRTGARRRPRERMVRWALDIPWALDFRRTA